MTNIFEYFTGLRGFHVYSNTMNWKPHIGQKISFKQEHNNRYDKFTVAGKTLLKGRIGAVNCWAYSKESFLDTSGMPYKKGKNFKLPFMIQRLSHRL